ncbi:MAG: hypothetical protein CM1200mP16_12870 [Nitrospina sp.]|nr:MAG: hypothetical protein CM1200mP16_12870 [Nitrospina sp.]
MKGGMPIYKYVSNRLLTLIENTIIQQKLSEYHTGYRAFSRKVLETIPLLETPMTLYSITKCFAKSYTLDLKWGSFLSRTLF